MTQQEHLQLIRAKCVELLELAKQRTPGRWGYRGGEVLVNIYSNNKVICGVPVRHGKHNAAFIASASGPFEAALASTVAAIDDSMWQPAPEGYCHPDNPWGVENTALIQQILASWPIELLQQ